MTGAIGGGDGVVRAKQIVDTKSAEISSNNLQGQDTSLENEVADLGRRNEKETDTVTIKSAEAEAKTESAKRNVQAKAVVDARAEAAISKLPVDIPKLPEYANERTRIDTEFKDIENGRTNLESKSRALKLSKSNFDKID